MRNGVLPWLREDLMTQKEKDPCPRCGGDGIEPDPRPGELDMALCLDLIPIACYDCHGSGEETELEWCTL